MTDIRMRPKLEPQKINVCRVRTLCSTEPLSLSLSTKGLSNNEMIIADFEDGECDYVRHRILLIENIARESAGSAFSTFKFLKAARRYLIDECGVDVLHGKALENELDIPMSSEWRTKQATTLTFSESVAYSVSRLEKYWARSGSFYLLPNLYGDPSKLMLVMLSERFKADLLAQEPSWSLFTDWSEKHSRKTAA